MCELEPFRPISDSDGWKHAATSDVPPVSQSAVSNLGHEEAHFHSDSLQVIKCLQTGMGPHINHSNGIKSSFMNLLIILKMPQKETKSRRKQVCIHKNHAHW